ncbi:hypothetical protein QOL99_00170 [Deinococcus sp. MIMF12]|uniref:Uncharacterized protein n=1 Tax=Deinococcus rhizophilus TaxID=3049544 RepID=A0ABT7JF39_9DEIO|nr:hypothetical protein [Deinococcus rhizophilus]MDL2342563.1 hypothetical protein [Deinococcus rhizophilus]
MTKGKKAPEYTLPAYYEYEGTQTGSLFGADGEPIARVTPGQILRVDTAEQAGRIEAHGTFRRTTAAKYNAQQPQEDGGSADAPATDTSTPTPDGGTE